MATATGPITDTVDQTAAAMNIGQTEGITVKATSGSSDAKKLEMDLSDSAHTCVVCRSQVEGVDQSRRLTSADVELFGLVEGLERTGPRICVQCQQYSDRKIFRCLFPTCTTPKKRMRRRRFLPPRGWSELPEDVRDAISKEFDLRDDLSMCCSQCCSRLERRMERHLKQGELAEEGRSKATDGMGSHPLPDYEVRIPIHVTSVSALPAMSPLTSPEKETVDLTIKSPGARDELSLLLSEDDDGASSHSQSESESSRNFRNLFDSLLNSDSMKREGCSFEGTEVKRRKIDTSDVTLDCDVSSLNDDAEFRPFRTRDGSDSVLLKVGTESEQLQNEENRTDSRSADFGAKIIKNNLKAESNLGIKASSGVMIKTEPMDPIFDVHSEPICDSASEIIDVVETELQCDVESGDTNTGTKQDGVTARVKTELPDKPDVSDTDSGSMDENDVTSVNFAHSAPNGNPQSTVDGCQNFIDIGDARHQWDRERSKLGISDAEFAKYLLSVYIGSFDAAAELQSINQNLRLTPGAVNHGPRWRRPELSTRLDTDLYRDSTAKPEAGEPERYSSTFREVSAEGTERNFANRRTIGGSGDAPARRSVLPAKVLRDKVPPSCIENERSLWVVVEWLDMKNAKSINVSDFPNVLKRKHVNYDLSCSAKEFIKLEPVIKLEPEDYDPEGMPFWFQELHEFPPPEAKSVSKPSKSKPKEDVPVARLISDVRLSRSILTGPRVVPAPARNRKDVVKYLNTNKSYTKDRMLCWTNKLDARVWRGEFRKFEQTHGGRNLSMLPPDYEPVKLEPKQASKPKKNHRKPEPKVLVRQTSSTGGEWVRRGRSMVPFNFKEISDSCLPAEGKRGVAHNVTTDDVTSLPPELDLCSDLVEEQNSDNESPPELDPQTDAESAGSESGESDFEFLPKTTPVGHGERCRATARRGRVKTHRAFTRCPTTTNVNTIEDVSENHDVENQSGDVTEEADESGEAADGGKVRVHRNILMSLVVGSGRRARTPVPTAAPVTKAPGGTYTAPITDSSSPVIKAAASKATPAPITKTAVPKVIKATPSPVTKKSVSQSAKIAPSPVSKMTKTSSFNGTKKTLNPAKRIKATLSTHTKTPVSHVTKATISPGTEPILKTSSIQDEAKSTSQTEAAGSEQRELCILPKRNYKPKPKSGSVPGSGNQGGEAIPEGSLKITDNPYFQTPASPAACPRPSEAAAKKTMVHDRKITEKLFPSDKKPDVNNISRRVTVKDVSLTAYTGANRTEFFDYWNLWRRKPNPLIQSSRKCAVEQCPNSIPLMRAWLEYSMWTHSRSSASSVPCTVEPVQEHTYRVRSTEVKYWTVCQCSPPFFVALFPKNSQECYVWLDMLNFKTQDGSVWIPDDQDFICSRHFRDVFLTRCSFSDSLVPTVDMGNRDDNTPADPVREQQRRELMKKRAETVIMTKNNQITKNPGPRPGFGKGKAKAAEKAVKRAKIVRKNIGGRAQIRLNVPPIGSTAVLNIPVEVSADVVEQVGTSRKCSSSVQTSILKKHEPALETTLSSEELSRVRSVLEMMVAHPEDTADRDDIELVAKFRRSLRKVFPSGRRVVWGSYDDSLAQQQTKAEKATKLLSIMKRTSPNASATPKPSGLLSGSKVVSCTSKSEDPIPTTDSSTSKSEDSVERYLNEVGIELEVETEDMDGGDIEVTGADIEDEEVTEEANRLLYVMSRTEELTKTMEKVSGSFYSEAAKSADEVSSNGGKEQAGSESKVTSRVPEEVLGESVENMSENPGEEGDANGKPEYADTMLSTLSHFQLPKVKEQEVLTLLKARQQKLADVASTMTSQMQGVSSEVTSLRANVTSQAHEAGSNERKETTPLPSEISGKEVGERCLTSESNSAEVKCTVYRSSKFQASKTFHAGGSEVVIKSAGMEEPMRSVPSVTDMIRESMLLPRVPKPPVPIPESVNQFNSKSPPDGENDGEKTENAKEKPLTIVDSQGKAIVCRPAKKPLEHTSMSLNTISPKDLPDESKRIPPSETPPVRLQIVPIEKSRSSKVVFMSYEKVSEGDH